jgi:hypothetical protein
MKLGGKAAAIMAGLMGAVNIGAAVKEGVEAVRQSYEHKQLKAKTERKYGTAGRAMATRHAQEKGAKSNVSGKKNKKLRKGNFKTIVATSGGKTYRRDEGRKRMAPMGGVDTGGKLTQKSIGLKLIGRGK